MNWLERSMWLIVGNRTLAVKKINKQMAAKKKAKAAAKKKKK